MRVLEGKLVDSGIKVGIVAARFNEFIVSKLVAGAKDGLVRHDVSEENIDLAWVPGAFEIPLIASKMAKSGKYASSKKTILSYGTFCVLLFGNFLPLYIDREAYFSTRQSFGAEYINSLSNIMQPWTAPAIIIAAFVCGMLGALLGKTLLKKHFVKAGIA